MRRADARAIEAVQCMSTISAVHVCHFSSACLPFQQCMSAIKPLPADAADPAGSLSPTALIGCFQNVNTDQVSEIQGKQFYLDGTRNSAAADMQAISSVTGIQMDSWTLMKPMNWVPAGPTNMSAKISAFNTIYNPNGNVGEIFGLPGANYTATFTPVYDAFMAQDASVISQLNSNSSVSKVLERAVNGNLGTGTADTMVDVWGVLQPAYNVLMSLISSGNVSTSVTAAADPIIIPMFQQIQAVAAAYNTSGGLWYQSTRSSSSGSTAVSTTATAGK